jgi:putative FmdB family regulatory protein
MMPTYEYECNKCKIHFDVFQKMTDEPLEKCPECKGKVHRLISSGSGIIFKGSGFYETDYKKKDKKEDKPPPSCQPNPDACRHCPSNPSAPRQAQGKIKNKK